MVQKVLIAAATIAFVLAAWLLLRGEFLEEPATRTETATDRVESPSEPDRPSESPPAESATAPGSTAGSEVRSPSSVPLPPLAESDAYTRERLAAFDLPSDWLARDGLVRRLAVFADNATRGEVAHKRLRFLVPEQRFRVVERDGRLVPDPRNARRFDPYLDRLEAVPPAEAAAFLATIEPLLDAAVGELGNPAPGREVIRDAIDRVLAFEPPTIEPELVRPKVMYVYADPSLEALPPLEKQLLRIGPGNLERLKRYLERLDGEFQ